MTAVTPTIVLVHGAWADATGFDAEIRALRERGYTAIGFGNPLRDLAGDAAYLAEFLRTLTGPILLVGHSYGGNVISVAATGHDQVRALVYFNGWMCDVGEASSSSSRSSKAASWALRSGRFRSPTRTAARAPTSTSPPRRSTLPSPPMSIPRRPRSWRRRTPYAAAAFAATPSAPPAWNTLPCWYLLGTQDKAIPPALQRFMAERANATIVEVPSSHVSFVSQPDAATQLILQAVEATTPVGAIGA